MMNRESELASRGVRSWILSALLFLLATVNCCAAESKDVDLWVLDSNTGLRVRNAKISGMEIAEGKAVLRRDAGDKSQRFDVFADEYFPMTSDILLSEVTQGVVFRLDPKIQTGLGCLPVRRSSGLWQIEISERRTIF